MPIDDIGGRNIQGPQSPQPERGTQSTSKTPQKDRQIAKAWKTHAPGEENPNIPPSVRKILSEKRAGKENTLAIVVHTGQNTTAKVAQEAIKPPPSPLRPPPPTSPPAAIYVSQFILEISKLAPRKQLVQFERLTNEERAFIVTAIGNPQKLPPADIAKLKGLFNKMQEPPSLWSQASSFVQSFSGTQVSPDDVRKAVLQESIKSKLNELDSILSNDNKLQNLFTEGNISGLKSALRKATLQLHPDKADPQKTRIFTDVYQPVLKELQDYNPPSPKQAA
jgi:hypothetical protein